MGNAVDHIVSARAVLSGFIGTPVYCSRFMPALKPQPFPVSSSSLLPSSLVTPDLSRIHHCATSAPGLTLFLLHSKRDPSSIYIFQNKFQIIIICCMEWANNFGAFVHKLTLKLILIIRDKISIFPITVTFSVREDFFSVCLRQYYFRTIPVKAYMGFLYV